MPVNPAFYRSFQALYGQPCWNAKRGYGSFMTLEFGQPHLEIREPMKAITKFKKVAEQFARRQVTLRGEWHLWIYCCHWIVFSGRKVIGDWSKDSAVDAAAEFLDGQKLTKASFEYRGCRTILEFDLGARLITRPYNADSEQWMLYEPDGNVLVLRADRMFTHKPSDAVEKPEQWQPAWSRRS